MSPNRTHPFVAASDPDSAQVEATLVAPTPISTSAPVELVSNTLNTGTICRVRNAPAGEFVRSAKSPVPIVGDSVFNAELNGTMYTWYQAGEAEWVADICAGRNFDPTADLYQTSTPEAVIENQQVQPTVAPPQEQPVQPEQQPTAAPPTEPPPEPTEVQLQCPVFGEGSSVPNGQGGCLHEWDNTVYSGNVPEGWTINCDNPQNPDGTYSCGSWTLWPV